jgi:hypothetical protein
LSEGLLWEPGLILGIVRGSTVRIRSDVEHCPRVYCEYQANESGQLPSNWFAILAHFLIYGKMHYSARHVRLSVCPSVCLSVRPWLHVFVDGKMRSLSLTAVSKYWVILFLNLYLYFFIVIWTW